MQPLAPTHRRPPSTPAAWLAPPRPGRTQGNGASARERSSCASCCTETCGPPRARWTILLISLSFRRPTTLKARRRRESGARAHDCLMAKAGVPGSVREPERERRESARALIPLYPPCTLMSARSAGVPLFIRLFPLLLTAPSLRADRVRATARARSKVVHLFTNSGIHDREDMGTMDTSLSARRI